MRPLLLPLLFLILAGLPSSGEEARPILGRSPNMTASSVVLDPADPRHRTFDALTYLGGLRLRSKDPAFGGFSSMLVRGDNITLLSDAGNIVSFDMGDDWQPSHLRFATLPNGPGSGWGKSSRDSESMTSDPATGEIWVGFEAANAVWRYDSGFTRGERHAAPDAMQRWDVNGGAEAMARMPDGSFYILSETSHAQGIKGTVGLYFEGDPTNRRTRSFSFGFRAPTDGFAPSDMVALPDGRLLVLVRRISINRWFESKLVLLDPRGIWPGASVRGREIAAFTMPLTRDNFEAMAVTQRKGGVILWLASDDNLEPVQQSLLMKFRLDLPPP